MIYTLQMSRNAGYVLAVELHAVNLAHAHARVEKEQDTGIARKLLIINAFLPPILSSLL